MWYRTKPSVEASICTRIPLSDDKAGFLVHYEPGDCTRYIVSFVPIDSLEARKALHFDMNQRVWIVSRLETLETAAMTVGYQFGSLLHWSQVQSALRTNKAEAVVLTELIGHTIGRAYISSEDVCAEEKSFDHSGGKKPTM
jgi:hypothetical protein